MIERFPDWKIRLNQYFTDKFDHKFKWGSNDCLQFVFGAERVINVNSRFSDVILEYSTEKEARLLMDNWGMDDMPDIMDERLERIDANYLSFGDVGLVQYVGNRGSKNVLSICVGRTFAHPWRTGLGFTERGLIGYGWRL